MPLAGDPIPPLVIIESAEYRAAVERFLGALRGEVSPGMTEQEYWSLVDRSWANGAEFGSLQQPVLEEFLIEEVSLDICWRCQFIAVDRADEIGLCWPCLEALRSA